MVRFSTRMNLLKGSAIRELLALANKPEILSFAGGMPAPELFPVDKIKAATDAVLEEQGKVALQYSSTNGFEHFRQQIADRMEAKLNIKTSADNILVTSGSQQGLDYSARVFCDKGDVVIIESPSYLGALNAFKACEPNFVAIPTDGDGMIMEELEKVSYDMVPAPRIAEDMTYIHGQDNREIRVYKYLDARLTLEDFFAKLALNFGDEK